MKRLLLAVALCLAGCSAFDQEPVPSGQVVQLPIPRPLEDPQARLAVCALPRWVIAGQLIWDAANGRVRMKLTAVHSPDDPSVSVGTFRGEAGQVGPAVDWPQGYTGVLAAGGVAIVDPAGNLVAMTGRSYAMKVSVGIVGAPADNSRGWIDSFNVCGEAGWLTPE
jgi:hypothetical protein